MTSSRPRVCSAISTEAPTATWSANGAAADPLIYFLGVVPGRYMASWPAYIVGDDPQALTFSVEVDGRKLAR